MVIDRRHKGIDPERVRELHTARLRDEAIAERLGCTRCAVLYWRRQLGLKAYSGPGPPRRRAVGNLEANFDLPRNPLLAS